MTRSNQLYRSLLVAWALTCLGMTLQTLVPALSAFGLIGALTLPGAALLLLLRARALTKLEQLLYSVGLSLITVMLTGLVTNLIAPLWGETRPLAPWVQTPAMCLVMLTLILAAWWRNQNQYYRFKFKTPSRKAVLAGTGLLAIPASSLIGALAVSGGGSASWVLTGYGLIAATAVSLVAWRRHVPEWLWPWTIFCMSLALLWSTSLRGLHMTGHDIQLEYYVFQLTSTAGSWSMARFQDAYNACLSITILPTVLKSLSGVEAAGLYKVVYQLIFALCATAVYALARRYATPTIAFVAAFIFITFPTFFTDMPMLARQEIAFFFFALLLLAVSGSRHSRWTRRVLYSLFAIGVVLSHYSTSFVMIALLVGAYVLYSLARLASRLFRRRTPSAPAGLSLGVVVVALAATVVWTGLYTKTGNNISSTIEKVASALPMIADIATNKNGNSYFVLKEEGPTDQEILDDYVKVKREEAIARTGTLNEFYPNAATFYPSLREPPTTAITPLGALATKLSATPEAIYSLGKTGYALGLQAAIMLGTILAVIYAKRFKLGPTLVVLTPVAVGLLTVQTVLPIIDYGLYRMLLQNLIFLVLPVTLGLMQALGWLKLRSQKLRLTLITAAFAGAFLITSGFTGGLTGGVDGQLPISEQSFYADAYYTHSQDITTFAWLEQHYLTGYPITTDKFTRMKILANTGITTQEGLTPGEITQKSYVVLAGPSISDDRVVQYHDGHVLYHESPAAFLDSNKNLLYSTNRTRVYQ